MYLPASISNFPIGPRSLHYLRLRSSSALATVRHEQYYNTWRDPLLWTGIPAGSGPEPPNPIEPVRAELQRESGGDRFSIQGNELRVEVECRDIEELNSLCEQLYYGIPPLINLEFIGWMGRTRIARWSILGFSRLRPPRPGEFPGHRVSHDVLNGDGPFSPRSYRMGPSTTRVGTRPSPPIAPVPRCPDRFSPQQNSCCVLCVMAHVCW